MEKNFELTEEFKINAFGVKVFRIKSTKKSKHVESGVLGGWVEKEENVSGNAWVYGDAEVSGDARVYGDAWVYGDAEVSGDARVYGDAWVYGNAEVYGDARVSGNAEVYGDARVSGNAEVYGDARVSGNAEVYGDARVYGNARVSGNAWVSGDARVSGNAEVYGNAELKSDNDFCVFSKFGSSNRNTTFFKTKEENVIKVKCGCFFGTILEFKEKVKSSHKGTKFEQQYLLMSELAELKLY